MYPDKEEIIKIVKTEADATPEEKTEKGMQGDPGTSYLGHILDAKNALEKEKMLSNIPDSKFHMSWDTYCAFVESIGFEMVLEIVEAEDALRIYAHKEDGLIVFADSFSGKRNSARLYYNWKPNLKPEKEWKDKDVPELIDKYWLYTSSGSFTYTGDDPEVKKNPMTHDASWEEFIWEGNHDARELLLSAITGLRENGTLLPIWFKPPHLWFIGHWETPSHYDHSIDYESFTQKKIKELPNWVKKIINQKES